MALILILIVSSVAHAQTTCTTLGLAGSLIIPVRDHSDHFDALLLSRMGEQEIAHTYVDMTGRFFFDNVPEGDFDFVVRLEGFKELRERVRIEQPRAVSAGTCTTREIFWLQPVDQVVIVDERLRGYPKEAIDEYVMAVESDNDKKYDAVVKHLEKVVKLAADWFDAHCELGAAYEETYRYSDAEKEYRTALELKPDSFRGLMSLGRLLTLKADDIIQDPATSANARPILTQAHEILATASVRDPMSAMASYMLGAVDFRLASYNAAETALKRALELDPKMYPARITLINVYVDLKQWQDALDNADTFIIENPNSPYRPQVASTRASVVRLLQAAR